MVALSPSTSGSVCVTRGCASPLRSSPPTIEPGRLENVETERRRGRDGVYGISHLDGPDFSMGALTWGVETRMGACGNSELARARGMGC